MFNRNCCPRQNMCCEPRVECCEPKRECPVTDPGVTNCVEREFYHEVPHVIPVHTHVINKHIYNHTYRPEYTCSEECQVINNECGRCNNFPNR